MRYSPDEARGLLYPTLIEQLERLPESAWPRFLEDFVARANRILCEGRPELEVLDGGREG